MRHLLACLVLCASLSASAQDDNCTVLGVQELSVLYSELNATADSTLLSLQEVIDALNNQDTLILSVSNKRQFESILVHDSVWTTSLAYNETTCGEYLTVPNGYYAEVVQLSPPTGWRINGTERAIVQTPTSGQNSTLTQAIWNQQIWLTESETLRYCYRWRGSYAGGNVTLTPRAVVKLYPID